MSSADEQLILDFYAAWNELGVEALEPAFAGDVVWHDDPLGPDGGTFHGREAMAARLATYVEVMGEFKIIEPRVTELEDGRYLAEFVLAIRGEGSGIALEQPHAHILRLADGAVVEARQVLDPARMREELGLPPGGG